MADQCKYLSDQLNNDIEVKLMKITLDEFKNIYNNIIAIEIKSVTDTINLSKKEQSKEEYELSAIMAQSYLKGLERGAEVIESINKQLENEEKN